ncbi:polysaccharide deacetylase family protein [Providencia sp. 21OH12SH02B-Prov]|uniref:polysaccharide deacetylase family protein n=1 Tax=unclassified Providencia TaxID=2633465 RepID=UPI0022B65F4D|nr:MULTISPECIES: polysaccharide deacetylase family protein [unclassified Providencia]ELR5121370.1 polysaccharide deacetylase family protein [Providencia stuartii]WBA57501.1 polysaccharide deacetylase family protein [Providencia sp. 21OH12SH02B-Prov]
MRNQSLMLFFIFLFLSVTKSFAQVPTQSTENWQLVDTPPALMQLKQSETIFAPIAGNMKAVAELYPEHGFYLYKAMGDYQPIQFGNDYAYVNTEAVSPLKPRLTPEDDRLNELSNPIYDYLITTKNTPVYRSAKPHSQPIATLFSNLRYPVLVRMIKTDKQGEKVAWLTIRLGDRLGYIKLDDVEIDKGIPILTYHHLLKESENKKFQQTSTTTSVEAFQEQMNYLQQAGYQTLSLADLEGYLDKSVNLPAKSVVLTFDDGLKSVYRYAYPILKHNQQQATLFVISSRIKMTPQKWSADGLQFMSKQEIKNCQDVFNIQSHTHFLHKLDKHKSPIIFSRQEHTIFLDFQRSMRILQQFEPEQRYLAYPFGGFNPIAMDAAKLSGIHLALTTIQGKVRLGDNPFALKRLYALKTDSIEKFARMVGNSGQSVVNENIVVDR